jgi:hypothetical protein
MKTLDKEHSNTIVRRKTFGAETRHTRAHVISAQHSTALRGTNRNSSATNWPTSVGTVPVSLLLSRNLCRQSADARSLNTARKAAVCTERMKTFDKEHSNTIVRSKIFGAKNLTHEHMKFLPSTTQPSVTLTAH